MKVSGLFAVGTVVALLATACAVPTGGNRDGPGISGPETTVAPSGGAAVGSLPSGPSALTDPSSAEFPAPLVPLGEIISGGPPPDGIPAIDHPMFVPVIDHLDSLEPNEPVVALEVGGDARAYPVRVLIWHEVVNDTVGGVPVSVTYCPLCNSATTYRREINGVETTFGTSGRLFASALVMYDRATESLWTHFDGRAVVGVLTGARLESIPSPLLAWDDFRSSYPNGKVLDFNNTGFRRDYGANPYRGYDDEDTFPFLFRGDVDERAAAKQRVVGVATDEGSAAFALDFISGGVAKATNTTVAGRPIAILWKAGQSSALDRSNIADGADVGSVGVFDPTVDGTTLTFAAEGADFVDSETASTWTITGEAVAGPLTGARLERVEHLDTFWFAWSTYQPGTALVDG